jgi:selenide,water dikinase
VQGLVHPARVFTKGGARPGDVLVLSKPIGTGILLAGGSATDKAAAITRMRDLNRGAAEALAAAGSAVHAVTDVTGFGLFGHGWEMAERSGVQLRFRAGALLIYAGALAAAEAGVRTGGDARNREHLAGRVRLGAGVGAALEALGYDPQTSGGLLAAVDAPAAGDLAGAGFVEIGVVGDGAPGVTLD